MIVIVLESVLMGLKVVDRLLRPIGEGMVVAMNFDIIRLEEAVPVSGDLVAKAVLEGIVAAQDIVAITIV